MRLLHRCTLRGQCGGMSSSRLCHRLLVLRFCRFQCRHVTITRRCELVLQSRLHTRLRLSLPHSFLCFSLHSLRFPLSGQSQRLLLGSRAGFCLHLLRPLPVLLVVLWRPGRSVLCCHRLGCSPLLSAPLRSLHGHPLLQPFSASHSLRLYCPWAVHVELTRGVRA